MSHMRRLSAGILMTATTSLGVILLHLMLKPRAAKLEIAELPSVTYICSQCGAEFGSLGSMAWHDEHAHRTEPEEKGQNAFDKLAATLRQVLRP